MKRKIAIFLIIFLSTIAISACKSNIKKQEDYEYYIKQGNLLYDEYKFEKAMKSYKKAFDISESVFGDSSIQTAYVYLKMSESAELFDEAIKYIEKAETIYENLENYGGLADVFYHYGLIYSQWKEKDLSIEAYETALAFCNKSNHTNKIKIDIYFSLAGHDIPLEETLEYLKEAERLLSTIPEEERVPYFIMIYSSLGNAYYNCNEDKLAMDSYEKVIVCWEKYGNSHKKSVAEAYDYYGYLSSLFDEYDRAIHSINQSIEMMEGMDYLSPWEKAIPYRHLSIIYTYKDFEDYNKVAEYGLESCRMFYKENNLSKEELEQLERMKKGLKDLYVTKPWADTDFETWFDANINE